MRIRRLLFEFEDLPWFPDVIRHGGTDFLRFFFTLTSFYAPVIPVLMGLLSRSGSRSIVDHCSGSGGNWEDLLATMNREVSEDVLVTLTDKYPGNFREHRSIHYHSEPVDVTEDVFQTTGVRTIFTAIHHFDEEQVKKIIANLTATGQPVAIFDGADRNVLIFAGILFLQPLLFAVFTPFFKPFKWTRILYTYLIPLIPLMTIWDGMVSVIRLYSHRRLRELASEANPTYRWTSGTVRNKLGFNVTWLTGEPASQA